MKIIKRIIACFIELIYLILIILIPIWWFIPQLISGKSHDTILDLYFNWMYEYKDDLFES